MDPDSIYSGFIILYVFLILILAFVSLCRSCVVTASDAKMRELADSGSKRARLIMRLTRKSEQFTGGFYALSVLIMVFAGILGAIGIFLPMRGVLARLPAGAGIGRILYALFCALVSCFLFFTAGNYIPQNVGNKYADRLALSLAYPAWWIYRLVCPAINLVGWFTRLILQLFGINPDDDLERVTEEEIRMMVDAGEESGIIEQSEKDMINNIFEFDDRTADQIMTHRTELLALEDTASIEAIVRAAVDHGYSRIPVYHEDLDNITGILYVKDLLPLIIGKVGEEFDLQSFMRKPYYIPESNRCSELFKQFKEKKIHMAIIVDEYGGTSGVVTMEDLLESIVGSMQDEYDKEEEEVSRISDSLYEFDGSVTLEEVEHALGVALPEDTGCDTLSALLTHIYGRIPSEEADLPSIELAGVRFTMLEVKDRFIDRVLAEKLEETVPANE